MAIHTFEYKGYVGVAEPDPEQGFLFGEVPGLRDVITFQGDTPAEAEREFRISIECYLDACAEAGRPPETPRTEPMP